MDVASDYRAHAQVVRRWRKRFGWASIISASALAFLVLSTLGVQYAPPPEPPPAITQSDLETILHRLQLRETLASEAERERLRAQIELVSAFLSDPEELPTRRDLKILLRNLERREMHALSDAEEERYRAQIDLVSEFLRRPHVDYYDFLKIVLSPPIISLGALVVSLLGFVSTTVMAWRIDRRAMRVEARAVEEHSWKRVDHEAKQALKAPEGGTLPSSGDTQPARPDNSRQHP